jgi:hypothetical protein
VKSIFSPEQMLTTEADKVPEGLGITVIEGVEKTDSQPLAFVAVTVMKSPLANVVLL